MHVKHRSCGSIPFGVRGPGAQPPNTCGVVDCTTQICASPIVEEPALNRKRRTPSSIQPPQLSNAASSNPQIVQFLEARATYAQQLWINLHFDTQEAEDVAFEQLDVRQASFQEADLPLLQSADCRFDSTDFANCSLDKAYLRRVEFTGCRLVGLKLTDADLEDVLFSRCNTRLARCWTSTAKAVRFEHCALQEASFDGSNLSGAVFYKCDLSGADFRNAKLKGADLRGSTLSGIQINSKDLAGAIIDPAQAIELIQLFGVTVRPEDL